jgi:hypothetical protein
LFSIPSLVLIGGFWKTGKTDFGLLISELCLKLGLVKQVTTNIETYGHYPIIHDLMTLKQWLHQSKTVKLYIFDEANVHMSRRRSLSKKNVGLIQLLPEVSKARARVIVIGQRLEQIDKEYQDDTWVRGVFRKYTKKNAVLVSPLIPRIVRLNNIPRTTIKFDPYATAPFTLEPVLEERIQDPQIRRLYEWAIGKTSWRDHTDHTMKWNRIVRKDVLRLIKTLPLNTINDGGYIDTEKERKLEESKIEAKPYRT